MDKSSDLYTETDEFTNILIFVGQYLIAKYCRT